LAVDSPVISSDGFRIAYKILQRHFTPNEATGSIIGVFDVTLGKSVYAFPEQSRIIRHPPDHTIFTWEDHPAEIHNVHRIFWLPKDDGLVFVCTHYPYILGDRGPGEVTDYLVLVNVPARLEEFFFSHRPISHRGLTFSVESVTLLDAETVELKLAGQEGPDRSVVFKLLSPN